MSEKIAKIKSDILVDSSGFNGAPTFRTIGNTMANLAGLITYVKNCFPISPRQEDYEEFNDLKDIESDLLLSMEIREQIRIFSAKSTQDVLDVLRVVRAIDERLFTIVQNHYKRMIRTEVVVIEKLPCSSIALTELSLPLQRFKLQYTDNQLILTEIKTISTIFSCDYTREKKDPLEFRQKIFQKLQEWNSDQKEENQETLFFQLISQ